MKLFKILLGTLVGLAVAVIAYILVAAIVSLVGQIPILGAILYYPSDASWALIVMPVTTSAFVGAYVSVKIAKTAAPVSAVLAVFWLLNLIVTVFVGPFSWGELVRSLLGIGTSCACFAMKDDVAEAKKKAYLVVDKDTGEVIDENFKM